MKSFLKKLIGKKVQLWPDDYHKKLVKIIDVDDTGIVFEGCPENEDRDWKSGLRFINWTHKIDIKELNTDRW